MNRISRLKLSNFLSFVAPDQTKEVRVNANKNLIAIGVLNAGALDKLLMVREVCGIPVRANVLGGRNTIAGVIQDVDPKIMEQDFAALISTTAPMVQVPPFPLPAFQPSSLPASVKVG